MARIQAFVVALLAAVGLSGCYVYGGPPPSYVDPVEQSFNAAVGAMQDAGLTITNADRGSGVVSGQSGQATGTIRIRPGYQGQTEVRINTNDADPNLSRRLTEAYNRRMGR